MTEEQQEFETSMTPPSEPLVHEAKSSAPVWPTVIGVIGIILGSLAAIVGCMGAVFQSIVPLFLLDFFRELSSQNPGMEMTVAQFEVMSKPEHRWPLLIIQVLLLIVALLLLYGGIGLLRRRCGAMRACVVWAVLKIALSLPSTWFAYKMNREIFEAMSEVSQTGAGPPMSGFFSMMRNMGTFGMILGLLWAWALPVFVLIWFGRKAVRDEVRTWG